MILSLTVFTLLCGLLLVAEATRDDCRCFPGETCWPSTKEWDVFNKTLGGRLIRPTPLGQPCHDPHFNATECKAIQAQWPDGIFHSNSPNSPQIPWISNMTCDAFALPRDSPCKRGNEVEYAVNVSKPEHVSKTLKLAKQKNIRVVVRNTGHDLSGKSVGAGGIAIWMHHLRDAEVKNYSSISYSGKAIKIQAGVQGEQLYLFAHRHGLQAVSGSCTNVGVAGGYTQGGGHSPLSSIYGLGADQPLEWEVIDGNGKMQIANSRRNKDLHWALSGGGGGTYSIIWSLTVKAYPATPISSANVTFTADGISKTSYYQAVEKFFTILPSLIDAPVTLGWTLTNSTFVVNRITGANLPAKHLERLLKPYIDYLMNAGIKHEKVVHQHDNFIEYIHDNAASNSIPDSHLGSWLIPRFVVEHKNAEFREAWEYVAEDGGGVTTIALNVSKPVEKGVDNAVLPAWRQAIMHNMVYSPIDIKAPKDKADEAQKKVTNDYLPRFAALAPDSGSYMNEADSNQKDFKKVFYGKNYGKLRDIKRKYDPDHIFYAITAVGSEEWIQLEDGHLCRT